MMKFFNKTALLTVNLMILCGVNTLANAAVTLDVEDNIKVTAINGQAMNKSLFQDKQNQFILQAGRHVITAKYDRLYDLRKDNHDYLRSGNITVTAQLDDNQTYGLVMPNQPEAYRDAKKFAKNPTLAVMQGSQVIVSQSAQNSNGSGLLSGVGGTVSGWFGGGKGAVSQNTQAIAAVNNSSTGIAPVTTSVITPVISTRPAVASNAQSGSTLDQFMQLWLEATPTERERIRSWVSQ